MKRSILIKMMNENIVSITDEGIVVDVQLLLPFLTREPILPILYEQDGNTYLRALVEKWDFQDVMMGEQYVSFNISSSKPIEWEVGDFCFFRGEVFTLNYKPSVTQNAKIGETGKAFEYENVKFDSPQEELTRCQLLDITATTGQYIPAQGTNYTGSSHFPLYCGETIVEIGGKLVTYTAVCVLAAKMQANLDRLYPNKGWQVLVDTTSTYKDSEGNDVLVTHTDDKVLQFDNKYISDALAEVHNTFELDYYVRGRVIYIGYKLDNLTEGLGGEAFAFGYGAGYPSAEDSGKGLFQIKKISDSQQKIVTRLRALGSTKNLPYRYYNKKYNLSQALFPLNLQLPDTFIPEGTTADAAGENTKWGHNKLRNQTLRAVKGDTNDSYIDKNDDAEHCSEGIREDSAKWDGTTDGLPEIYPTIEGAKYKELRDALVEDQDGNIGQGSFPKYLDEERIDELLAIGYLSNGTLIDDANKGDGILAENGEIERGLAKTTKVPTTRIVYPTSGLTPVNYEVIGGEVKLFTVSGVAPGRYAMAPTEGNHVMYGCKNVGSNFGALQVGYIIYIRQKNVETGVVTDIATYKSDTFSVATADDVIEVELPKIPDSEQETPKVSEIRVTEFSDVIVSFAPYIANVRNGNVFTFDFYIDSPEKKYNPEYVWFPLDGSMSISDTFHVFIKDMGFDITACFTDDTPVVAMKSGKCVGREFEIGENVEKVTYNGYKGYMLTLSRATDNSLNTYYPSATDPIAAGDNFVLLNINMPEVFIKLAEVRLLRAATDYLADNSDTQFSYQPVISCNYLQRNYDRMLSAGTPEASILWRLYAGLKFSFRGIPSDSDSPLPTADITIERVVIHMGDGATPKVDITLNDDVQQTTLQKLTSTVDRIYNGSLAGGGIGGASTANVLSLIQSEGKKRFLSKKEDDSTTHKLTMGEAEVTGDLEVGGDTTLDSDLNVNGTANLNNTNVSRGSVVSFGRDGDYIENEQGGRVSVDANGLVRAQVDYLQVNRKMTAKEVEIQEVTHLGGKVLYTAARMRCVKVEEVTAIVQQRRVVVGYKCYFENDDGEGQHIYNQFRVGDQAYCETWNLGGGTSTDFSNQFYWRLVTEAGEDYIVLSADDCAADSTIPRAGDDIVQLGYRKQSGDTDAEAFARQGAIIQTAAESVIDGSKVSVPSISLFKGINSYVLPNPFILLSPNESHISSTTINLESGKTLDELVEQSYEVYQSEYNSKEDADAIEQEMADLVASWTTPEDVRDEHVGDFFLAADGFCWMYYRDEESDPVTYLWRTVDDEYLTAYVNEISKRTKTFVFGIGEQPYQPNVTYKVGDIWADVDMTFPPTQSSPGVKYDKITLVCISARAKGDDFSIAHWKEWDGTRQLVVNQSATIQQIENNIGDIDASIGSINTSIGDINQGLWVGTDLVWYEAVKNPTGNPKAKGYYELDTYNKPKATSDTSIVSGKTYYERKEKQRAGLVTEDNFAGLLAQNDVGTKAEISVSLQNAKDYTNEQIAVATIQAGKVIIGTNDNNKTLNEVLVVQGDYVWAKNLAVEGFLNRGVAELGASNIDNIAFLHKDNAPNVRLATEVDGSMELADGLNVTSYDTVYSFDMLLAPDTLRFTGEWHNTDFVLPFYADLGDTGKTIDSTTMEESSLYYQRPLTNYQKTQSGNATRMTLAQMRALIGRRLYIHNNSTTANGLVFHIGIWFEEYAINAMTSDMHTTAWVKSAKNEDLVGVIAPNPSYKRYRHKISVEQGKTIVLEFCSGVYNAKVGNDIVATECLYWKIIRENAAQLNEFIDT